MRPVGSDFTHGTQPMGGPTFTYPDGYGGTYQTSPLYAGAWDHTRFRGIEDTLHRLKGDSPSDKIIDAATDIRRFFLDRRNRPNQQELDAIFTHLSRLNRPALWYAYTLGLHHRSFKLFNTGIKNLYQREMENVHPLLLRDMVENVADSKDSNSIKGLKKELEVVRTWVMENHQVFGPGHQTELTLLIGKLRGDVKDVFFTNAILAEIGDTLGNLRYGNRFFKNIANFFTRKVSI